MSAAERPSRPPPAPPPSVRRCPRCGTATDASWCGCAERPRPDSITRARFPAERDAAQAVLVEWLPVRHRRDRLTSLAVAIGLGWAVVAALYVGWAWLWRGG